MNMEPAKVCMIWLSRKLRKNCTSGAVDEPKDAVAIRHGETLTLTVIWCASEGVLLVPVTGNWCGTPAVFCTAVISITTCEVPLNGGATVEGLKLTDIPDTEGENDPLKETLLWK